MCVTDKAQIAREILAYLAERRGAQDTLEGIAEWWLWEQRVVNRTSEVREAVGELVGAQLLVERKGRDGRTHYRVNRRRAGQIRSLLGGGGA
jgi:hypothetical protein